MLHRGARARRGSRPRPSVLPGCVSPSSAWSKDASHKAVTTAPALQPMHSALRINSSALAPQQINMASGCELPGAGDVVGGEVFILHYEGPSRDYQQHNQNKQASNKTLRTGDRRDESVGKAGVANSSRWKERTESLYIGVPWLVTAVIS